MRITRSINAPPTPGNDWDERWGGPDKGVICSWLRGIEKATEEPLLAAKARAGELPELPWRGGVKNKIKAGEKVGAHHYLAAWQGLRGEDLDINPEEETTATCSRTGVRVTFTSAIKKLLAEGEDQDVNKSSHSIGIKKAQTKQGR